MKKYKIGTCGYYDTGNTNPNGQTVRTCSITNEIINNIGVGIKVLSYHKWRKNPFLLFLKFIMLEIESERLLLFPDENAIKILIPLAIISKKLFKTKIYYNVIGGWLPDYLTKKKQMQNFLKKLDGIFVQTSTLKNELAVYDIKKVYIFPNFKNIKIFREDELLPNSELPLKICFMSRITEQKGVEEMIQVIKHINQNEVKYLLDIYGPISDEYRQHFVELEKEFPPFIKYKGVVDPLKTSEILQGYFLQLFPTKYKTEGFPGSILDSYCAGVPVLASRWNSYSDVIDEGINSISFSFNDFDDMTEKLEKIYDCPENIIRMKQKCIQTANRYKPENVIKIMMNVLFEDEYEK